MHVSLYVIGQDADIEKCLLYLAEALAEAVYLLQTAARFSGTQRIDSQQRPTHNRVVVCVASEPSRIYVPWPFPADCKVMAGMASHLEICQVIPMSSYRCL